MKLTTEDETQRESRNEHRADSPAPPFGKSMELFRRAAEVIPCGIYGHQSPAAALPGASPYYAERASGSRYWDVDGREYIDFMCGYGPIVLGYGHPEVEEAAARQRKDGDTMNHPSARMVELAERLVDMVDFSAWCVFGKNGGDMTSWAIRVAREQTRKKKILRVAGAYHGIDPWCSHTPGGLIEEDRSQIHTFKWNDLESFNQLIRRHVGKVAGVVVTPFHHPSFGDCEMPDNDFLQVIERTCHDEGIVLILDDIRAGFRLHLGGSHRVFGIKPDIICFSKALGNGYPISAALGSKELRVPASRVFLTGSFWNSAAPMAASLKTLEILERDDVPAKLNALGLRLKDGLVALGEKYGRPIVASGPPATPFYRFADETNFRDWQQFCAIAMEGRNGLAAFFHPHHNWFLSATHSEKDIDQALEIADQAFVTMNELPR
ncbi:aminotransferase class III-fold pyridoxal phosphate-dependent enzyme [Rubellicoccus peritrichatus]|uniref:Aminotransferase class III-fold pyridoxal phosphate-dependent enzyme n=1 Tax=Rubellicoccus peritrichatus TaxID=3080537 RepID=A0AAQ3LFH1_9BACT|nr:aminotransferase class III-fold pyridoxal phosphate-dependent enzyme [Puniceicoccus sp. CR14]WOO41059.1 aminotransferase class III-fold pyridoxal phosphate-dependent enzyme [Puniceicoccus sp. CR14]